MTSPYALSAVGLAVFSALSFSASANTNDDQIIVSANRFQQPVSSVLAPVTVVTREEIDKWQSNSVVDILRRLRCGCDSERRIRSEQYRIGTRDRCKAFAGINRWRPSE